MNEFALQRVPAGIVIATVGIGFIAIVVSPTDAVPISGVLLSLLFAGMLVGDSRYRNKGSEWRLRP